jgi:hypothetical protein
MLLDELITEDLDGWAKGEIDSIVADTDSRIISTEILPVDEKVVFDETSAYWNPTPEYNAFFLRAQQNYLNDKLSTQGHLFLNEVLDVLGLKRTSDGAITGWMPGSVVTFGVFEDEESFKKMLTQNKFEISFNTDGVIFNRI